MAVDADLVSQVPLFWAETHLVYVLGPDLVKVKNEFTKGSLLDLQLLTVSHILGDVASAKLFQLVYYDLTLRLSHDFRHWREQVNEPLNAKLLKI